MNFMSIFLGIILFVCTGILFYCLVQVLQKIFKKLHGKSVRCSDDDNNDNTNSARISNNSTLSSSNVNNAINKARENMRSK